MRLIDNPFKILEVTPSDSVDIINQNAEDKAFVDDEKERLYEDARTTLLSPAKRIAAEAGWIYNRNINSVFNDIENNIVNLNNCDSLEKVNILIEALYKSNLNQIFSVIVSLDQSYREASDSNFANKVLNKINSARKNAGINPCEDESLIQTEIKQKLSEINSAVNYLFVKYEDDDLIKVTNLIAANTIESGSEYGQVIDALINQYAVHFSDDLTRKKDHILARIEGLKNISSESGLYSFCEEVRAFDNEAQPIQLFLQKSGQSKLQVESNEVAYAVRDFAVFLYEKNNIEEAITLINLGIEVFPELPDVFNVLKEDRKVFLGLKARQTKFAEIDNMIKEGWKHVQCDVKYAENNKQYLMSHAPSIKVRLDAISKMYLASNDTNSDQYYGGCMNCAYYYSQLGHMLSWGAFFFDAIDSFTKSKLFAEKCGDTDTVEEANNSISSLNKLISDIGHYNVPRLKFSSPTMSSYSPNKANTHVNANTSTPNTAYTNSNSNSDSSDENGFSFKTLAIVAIVIFALYSFFSGNNTTPRRSTSTVNGTSQKSGNLVSSYTAPTVPQAPVTPQAPVVPKINHNAIIAATHSSADQEGSYIHSAKLAVDGNIASCWSEGVPGLGIGESIIISFNGTYEVNGMLIWPGHQKSETLFYQNARPSVIRVVGSNGYSERCYITDKSGMQRINFNRSMNVSGIQLIIEQAKPGTKYADTCIAEVEFF